MDKLLLHGIKITTIIGVYEWERQNQQTLIVDLDLALPNSKAGITDDLDDTLNYADIVKRLRAHCQTTSFQLIEALAENIANFLMAEFAIPWLKIHMIKPGILADVQKVAIVIERGESL